MRFSLTASCVLTAFIPLAAVAQDSDDDAAIERGKYLATAADCTACHGIDFAGGDPIASPIGNIYASNITPDANTGIGAWNENDFADALRKGRAPGKGWLFPAMPYTSYTGLSDDDVAALYAYFQSIPAVENSVQETDLGFPFVRPAMMAWNLLNLDEGHPVGAIDVTGDAATNGRFLVETLGHCTACHTPRDALMGERDDMHLSGAMVDGWHAPNITPDDSGIGQWSDADLAAYLQTGHNAIAVAGGKMAVAVEHSLSKLPDDDIADIGAYLREVPAIATAEVPPPLAEAPAVSLAVLQKSSIDWQTQVDDAATDGAQLYQGACASCHGMDGVGLLGPDLVVTNDIRTPEANNLVQVIAHGISVTTQGKTTLMPGFRDEMSDAQIAAVTNYTRTTFGGIDSGIDAANVNAILDGTGDAPWLIRNAFWLSIVGIAVAALLLIAVLIWATGRLRNRNASHG